MYCRMGYTMHPEVLVRGRPWYGHALSGGLLECYVETVRLAQRLLGPLDQHFRSNWECFEIREVGQDLGEIAE